MNHFALVDFARLIKDLQYYECACEMSESTKGAAWVNEVATGAVLQLCQDTQAVALKIESQEIFDIAATSATNIKSRADLNVSGLRVYAQTVKDAVVRYAFYGKFLYIQKDRGGMVDQPTLLGAAVSQAFPKAVPDIRDAGNCLAAECNTAAVFHLMRVVEWGLRYLGGSFKLTYLKQTSKGGKIKLSPLPWSQWEDILNQIQIKIDQKLIATKKGSAKQRDQEFYYPILQDISGVRDAWRNHVMHTRSEYDRKQAEEILGHVTRIMSKLATRAGVKKPKDFEPEVITAKWGVGGSEYWDVTDLLRGYLAAHAKDLRAANEFFVDHYPNRFKHLIVEYRMPGDKKSKTLTFQEGALVKLKR